MKLTRQEVLTIPNELTAARFAASPWVALKLYREPESWPLAAAFALSDIVDGKLARLGDKHPRLARLGFRRSELGRKADPFTDKVFTAEVLVAGMKNGVVPKWLGAISLAQKAVVSGITIYNEAHGAEVEVTKLGKYSEFATNTAIGSLFIAESATEGEQREQMRQVAMTVAAGGIAGALVAGYGYYRAGQSAQ